MQWQHCTVKHVCVCLLTLWHTILRYINSCLRRDLHYWFCVACIQGPLLGNVSSFSDLCLHTCHCGTMGHLLGLLVLTLSNWKPIHHTEKKGLGREKREEKRASQEVVNKTMAALHFMVLKAIHHNGPTVRLPACISVEGIKPMPNSLMSMDVEEWAIIKSHRQTAGDHSHLCTIRCCEVGIAWMCWSLQRRPRTLLGLLSTSWKA